MGLYNLLSLLSSLDHIEFICFEADDSLQSVREHSNTSITLQMHVQGAPIADPSVG
jgi:hypothetical protein